MTRALRLGRRESKQARLLLQPHQSPGQTLWQVCNCGNEERWSHSMKGHCLGLKCMNSCCYYAWFFGFAGARRFFSKAYNLVQYINICNLAHEPCQTHSSIELKGHHSFVFLNHYHFTSENRSCRILQFMKK